MTRVLLERRRKSRDAFTSARNKAIMGGICSLIHMFVHPGCYSVSVPYYLRCEVDFLVLLRYKISQNGSQLTDHTRPFCMSAPSISRPVTDSTYIFIEICTYSIPYLRLYPVIRVLYYLVDMNKQQVICNLYAVFRRFLLILGL